MPNGDFTNPRYLSENVYLSDEELKEKYGYVPRVNGEDYDCEREYLSALSEARRVGGYDYDDYLADGGCEYDSEDDCNCEREYGELSEFDFDTDLWR